MARSMGLFGNMQSSTNPTLLSQTELAIPTEGEGLIVQALSGSSVPWATILFITLGVLYVGGGLLMLLRMVQMGGPIYFSQSRGWKERVRPVLEFLWNVCFYAAPLAMIAGGVGVFVACSRTPVDLHILLWSSLVPIAYILVPAPMFLCGVCCLYWSGE